MKTKINKTWALTLEVLNLVKNIFVLPGKGAMTVLWGKQDTVLLRDE